MRSSLLYRATSGLLLVHCAIVQCGVVQESSSVDQRVTLSAALSQPGAILGQAVQTAVQTLATELDARLEDVQTRLAGQVSGLSSRLDWVNTELRTQVDRNWTMQSAPQPLPRDCSDLPAGAQSGVHLLQLGLSRSESPVAAFCDLDTAGGNWTVIQRRADIQPRQNFFLGWIPYKEGFGELDAEFWWGLDHVWKMTSSRDRRYELRFDMEDFDGGHRHAVYQGFRISSESDGYRLTAVNYTGDAGDSFSGHSGMRFSTKDKDQDTSDGSCAQSHKGGWWYSACHASNLNGLYLAGQHDSYADGVNWYAWKGHHYSLETVTVKIRPSKKL